MARVQPYERGVNAILHTNSLITIDIQSEQKIKEELINTTSATSEDCAINSNCRSLINHNYHCSDKLSLTKINTNNRNLSDDSELYINRINKMIVNVESKSAKLEKGIHNTLAKREEQKCHNEVCPIKTDNTLRTVMEEVRKSRKRKRRNTISECAEQNQFKIIKKHKYVECKICFRIFSSFRCYQIHSLRLSKTVCTFCKKRFRTYSTLSSHLSRVHIKRLTKFRYKCNFCMYSSNTKCKLQSHLYHAHYDLICLNTTTKHQTLKSEKVDKSPKNIASKINIDKESRSSNLGEHNLQSKKISGFFKNSINKSSDDNVMDTEKLNHKKSLNNEMHPIKKLRQTTLTEYIELYKKCDINVDLSKLNSPTNNNTNKQIEKNSSLRMIEQHTDQIESSPIKLDNLPKQMTHSIPEQTDVKDESSSSKKPFVRLHADFEMMQSFLDNLSDTNVADKENRTHDNVSCNHEIPYSLRSSNTVFSIDITSHFRRRRNKSKNFVVNTKSSEKNVDVICVNPKVDWEIMKSRFKCKKCTIPLVRCDEKSENSYQNSTIDAAKNTSVIAQINSTSLPENEECNAVKLKDFEIYLERLTVPIENTKTESTLNTEEHKNIFCKICDASFSSREDRRVHIKSVHIAYMSSICNARYTLKQNLLQHFLTEHLVEQNKCCVCYKLMPNYEALKQHLTIHCLKYIKKQNSEYPTDIELKCSSARTLYRCLSCNQTFSSQLLLEEHRRYHVIQKEMERNQENSTESLKQTEASESLMINFKVEHEEVVNESTVTRNEGINPDSGEKESDINRTCLVASGDTVRERSNSINKPQNSKNLSKNSGSTIRNENTTVITNKQSDNPAVKVYPCNVCGKQFHTPKNLTIHIRAFGFTSDVCPICGTGFSSKRFLQTHITAAHVPQFSKTYSIHCIFCNQGFTKKYDLRPHILHLHREQLLNTFTRTLSVNQETPDPSSVVHTTICKICNLVFETHDRFVEHRMYYYNNHTFTCTLCMKNFQGLYMFHHHNKLEHYSEDKRKLYSYICKICNEGFNHEMHFHSHNMHVHSNEANSAKTAKEIEKNDSGHTSVIKETRKYLTSQQIQEEQPSNQYTCEICQLKCKDENELINHKDFYSNDGDFKCNKCGKRCKTLSLLNYHEHIVHTNRPASNKYTCYICREIFKTVISLKCHERHFHPDNSNTVDNWKKDSNQTTPSTNKTTNGPHEPENDSFESNNYSCVFCNMKFLTTNSIQTHIVYAHMEDMELMITNRNDSKTTTTNNVTKQVVENGKASLTLSGSEPISFSSLLSELITTLTLSIPGGNSTETKKSEDIPIVSAASDVTSKVNTSILSSAEPTTPKTITSNVQSKDNTPVILPGPANYLQKNNAPEKSLKNIKPKPITISSLSEFSAVFNQPQSYKSINITNNEPESINSYFKCPLCPLEYPSLLYFHAHLKYVHASSIYQRDVQNELTSSWAFLSQNKPVIQCLLCPCNFTNEMRYKTHLRQIHTYCMYIPNLEQTANKNNHSIKIEKDINKIALTTSSNKTNNIPEVITVDDDDDDNNRDNNLKTTDKEAAKVTPTSDQNTPNNKIGKLRVKSFAKIIENLSTDCASNLL
ncbi:hypothetical protein PUN28_018836 [Cardiocondyla obscurior]|uniref:C2H2-type domain-containing protein n=1 Tax=Cardiocondyla obscurior TaxID=286306 RepID=A0AAW2ED38_9HYME